MSTSAPSVYTDTRGDSSITDGRRKFNGVFLPASSTASSRRSISLRLNQFHLDLPPDCLSLHNKQFPQVCHFPYCPHPCARVLKQNLTFTTFKRGIPVLYIIFPQNVFLEWLRPFNFALSFWCRLESGTAKEKMNETSSTSTLLNVSLILWWWAFMAFMAQRKHWLELIWGCIIHRYQKTLSFLVDGQDSISVIKK